MKSSFSQHPLNLTLRFILEMVALFSVGLWGWVAFSGFWPYLLIWILPAAAAFLWANFRYPDEPLHPVEARYPISGKMRLLLELSLFGFAGWAFFSIGAIKAGFSFSFLFWLHYAFSYDRVWELLKD